ncbi:MAG: HNH endonuclease [Steroidobacteraceae bacterium]|nr:HNH endonuclease [Steroidobacteraceae bacterium]
MKLWVGVTDNRWWSYLEHSGFDEVNFWQPSATPLFTNLPPGTPFLFKLKRPHNHIAGGGYFVKFSSLPIALAWEAFGQKNGAESLDALERTIRPMSPDPRAVRLEIGCTVLAQPFFFPRENWIPAPSDWSGNIVRGKTFDDHEVSGRAIWDAVRERLGGRQVEDGSMGPITGDPLAGERYTEPFLARARLGQGAFRVLVTEAYRRRCAITGESTLPVLEAAHIRPFSMNGPNRTSNGLLLRSDFHKLFDQGLVTVTPDFTIKVSRRIRDQWFNGKAYYRLDGEKLAVLPSEPRDAPDREMLRWHSEERFAG